ncbi:MAG: hypothetical protein JKX80_02975 [Candidatus Pacebacteria bacterium]|nr:hypothetical protein [Candidatus Paceibacterota bacterium]
MKHLRGIFFAIAVFGLTTPVIVFAEFQNPLKRELDSVAGFTAAFLKAVIFIVFPIAVVFVVYSGFLFVTAQGNPEGLATAKRNFLWTIIGVGLLLGAWALALLIKGTIDPILG